MSWSLKAHRWSKLPRPDLGGGIVIAQSKAELLKIRSTRTALGLVLGMIALVVLTTLLTGLLTKAGSLSMREDQRSLLAVGSLVGVSRP